MAEIIPNIFHARIINIEIVPITQNNIFKADFLLSENKNILIARYEGTKNPYTRVQKNKSAEQRRTSIYLYIYI